MQTVQAALLIKASLCRMSDLYIGMAASVVSILLRTLQYA